MKMKCPNSRMGYNVTNIDYGNYVLVLDEKGSVHFGRMVYAMHLFDQIAISIYDKYWPKNNPKNRGDYYGERSVIIADNSEKVYNFGKRYPTKKEYEKAMLLLSL